ncbi:MAG: sodium:proton antiporter [Candidatus Atribacteria bacterium]|nr:sodium:proton antiporter [Candidatus Atribacteria bacterium]
MNEMSKIVRTVANFVYGLIIIFGFYIIVHGHLTPGGGFQGGAVAASAFALALVSYGQKNSQKFLKKDIFSLFESFGLTLFIVLAFSGLGITFFYNFLANSGNWFGSAAVIGINPGDLNTGGLIPLMNIAVGLEVLSALGVILLTMAKGAEFTKKKENS